MKPYHLYIAFPLLLLTGCKEEDYMELFEEDRPFELKVLKESVILDAVSPEQETIKSTWTTAFNCGTNAVIIYTFQMNIQGNNFTGGINESLGREACERMYKNEELNDLLPNILKAAAGTGATMEIHVVAQAASGEGMKQQTNVKIVVFRTHTPISDTLYVISNAVPHSWSADRVGEIGPVESAPKTFA